ncbi:hypothetical protein [Streptomyces sp. 1222.5]|uniref:hypothetical protein n=1 Tax=Streptomyces sp. 1222.5 TaxID=1881026 RepID=UPI003EBFD597
MTSIHTGFASDYTARVTNHLHRLGWHAVATPDYIEVRIPIEAGAQQAAAKRGDRLYVWPTAEGMRWEIRSPGAPQGAGEVLDVPGPHYVQLVAEIDHLLGPAH